MGCMRRIGEVIQCVIFSNRWIGISWRYSWEPIIRDIIYMSEKIGVITGAFELAPTHSIDGKGREQVKKLFWIFGLSESRADLPLFLVGLCRNRG